MTFLTDVEHVYRISVNISFFVNYYLFRKELEALYIGVGSDCDFMNYLVREKYRLMRRIFWYS
jgi:hypothetical protein